MKRFCLVLVLILTVALAAGAQAGETTFGLKAGVSIANIKGDNTDALDTKTGFMGGGFASIPISAPAAIQPEVFYVQKGAKFGVGDVDASFKLEYIEIPVLFKYTVDGESARPFFLLGPSFGYKISAKTEANGLTADVDDVSSTDFGLVFGLGMNMQKFLIEFRYTLGLSNINDLEGDSDSLKNSAFGILAGITF
jgi:hypothetical protein